MERETNKGEQRMGLHVTDIQLDPTDQVQVNRPDARRGCMKCSEKQLISTFGALDGGEHLEMRGNIRCCKNRSLYSHHAIVDRVHSYENDGVKASISLFGIPDTGGQIRQENRELDLDVDKVRLIEYNMRKFDLPQTKERAKSVANRGVKVPYRLFTRNCENFATICVVGNDNIDVNLSDSSTQQGRSFFMAIFNCVCVGSRFASSLLSFFLYITFVAGDNIIDIVPKSSAALFSSMCRVNATTAKGAKDHRICHLEIQAIFVGVYLLYIILYMCFICSGKFTCRRCKVKSVLVVVSRFFLYCILELLLIFLEPYVFTKIKGWLLDEIRHSKSLRQFLLVVIAFVKSAIECTLIYWISNCIATTIPKYLVNKKSIDGLGIVQKGDVISWKRGLYQCSVDAIVVEVHAAEVNGDTRLDIIYEEACSWTMFCTKVVKESGVLCDPKRMKVYDFSDFSHKYPPEEVVSNAEDQLINDDVRYGIFCFNRSSNFCYSAKVKDISCPERFNSCEKCYRCICCF